MKLGKMLLICSIMLVLAACSSVPPRERMAASLADYEVAAGEPVNSFWFPRLQSWEPLGEDRLVVRTGPRDAYLLRVERPCTELPWAHSISIKSGTSRVNSRFDSVQVRGQRCRILEIREVNEAAYREARKARLG